MKSSSHVERTRDAKGLSRGDERLPLEGAADQVDDVEWEVGEVSEGFMFDLAVLPEGASEVVTGIGDPVEGVGDFGDMNRSVFACHGG